MLVHQEIMLRRGVSLVEGHQRWVTEGAAQHLMSALTLPFDLDNVNGLYTGSHYMNWDALGCLFLLFLCLLLVWQRQGLDKHSAKQITILGSLGLYFWNHQKRSPDYSLERHFHSQTFLCTLSKSFPVFFFFSGMCHSYHIQSLQGPASSLGGSLVGTIDLFLSHAPPTKKLWFMLFTSPSSEPLAGTRPCCEAMWHGAILQLPGRVYLSSLEE